VRVATPSSTVDASVQAVAAENAGGPVEALTGSRHTVYHSAAALPDETHPRADGRPTLIWFSGTWCDFCERMDPFAYDVMAAYRERAVFVEKSVDHDRNAAARYGIRGTPTFVLIDAAGNELTRFGFQPTAGLLGATIEQALDGAES
jgi:thiol-disulfide isomerase/thioredoxin